LCVQEIVAIEAIFFWGVTLSDTGRMITMN